MKKYNSLKMKSLNVIIYAIMAFTFIAVSAQTWEMADKVIFSPEEFDNLDIDKPIIRPYQDVFFYLNPASLKNDPEAYQKIQRNKLILKSLTGIVFSVLLILLLLQLRKLILSAIRKDLFLKNNLKIIRNIAYLLGIWIIIDFIFYQCIQFFIPLSFVEENINYIPLNKGFIPSITFSINFSLLLAAFSFYVIYTVLKEGLVFKEQSDLTI